MSKFQIQNVKLKAAATTKSPISIPEAELFRNKILIDNDRGECQSVIHHQEFSWNRLINKKPGGALVNFPHIGHVHLPAKDRFKMSPNIMSYQFKASSNVVDTISTNLTVVEQNNIANFTGKVWFRNILKGQNDEILKNLKISVNVRLLDAKNATIMKLAAKEAVSDTKYCWTYKLLPTVFDMWQRYPYYFPENSLRLRFELIILNAELGDHVLMPKTMSTLSVDLSSLLDSGYRSDASIICAGRTFQIHKFMVSARSPVFSKMFSTDMTEKNANIVNIQDIKPEIVDIMLKYIYSGNINLGKLTLTILSNLAKASDKYMLDGLKRMCFEQLLRKIDMDSCGNLAILAYLHSSETLEGSRKYIQEKWSELTSKLDFNEMMVQYPTVFVKPTV